MRISDWSSDVCSSDLDKRCFAIPTGNPRLSAIVHENIDLIEDANRFLVVLHRDEAGKVERIEGHTIALPAPAITFEADIDVDELVRASEFVGIYEAAAACPPRPSPPEFARTLQACPPLQTPTGHQDSHSDNRTRCGRGKKLSIR